MPQIQSPQSSAFDQTNSALLYMKSEKLEDTWDGYPDGTFTLDITHDVFEKTKRRPCIVTGGDPGHSKTASNWQEAKKSCASALKLLTGLPRLGGTYDPSVVTIAPPLLHAGRVNEHFNFYRRVCKRRIHLSTSVQPESRQWEQILALTENTLAGETRFAPSTLTWRQFKCCRTVCLLALRLHVFLNCPSRKADDTSSPRKGKSQVGSVDEVERQGKELMSATVGLPPLTVLECLVHYRHPPLNTPGGGLCGCATVVPCHGTVDPTATVTVRLGYEAWVMEWWDQENGRSEEEKR
ncbi:hypothetical protein BDZ89DRAFT_1117442 [Hymenopellis radicata]|nr:hypothetical protein BDZ89DRAFT_1117442 [Hymenopellis radicata]